MAPSPIINWNSARLTSLKPRGFAILAPGCASPIRVLTSAYSRLRTRRYTKDATAQKPAAPRTPRDFAM